MTGQPSEEDKKRDAVLRRKPAAPKPDPSTIGFTNEEVERRALETARRVLVTPKPSKRKPAFAKAERTRQAECAPHKN